MTAAANNDAAHKLLLKNALLALDEMQARLDAAAQARHAPIAIVGMGCRFPGGASDPDAYWQLLIDGVDAVRPLPPERWPSQPLTDADLPATWYGGFLDGIDQFDPQFFGISRREADSMDPQQRLVLEVGWEALESAGLAPDGLSGSATGVFLGITTNDYGFLLRQAGSGQMDAYAATGSSLNAAAGRLAFTLGLQGPSLAVDTACSSSLVAVHLACQSLRSGECSMALAGGVNAALALEGFICSSRWGMLAPDGHCKTFDAAADGFVRGEGCGIVVLKRLADALAQGDRVRAVIRGSAVNQDGRSSGLTVPNGPAQQAVLRQALADAGVQPAQIGFIEAHGTGTALGDPIEVEALGAVLGESRTEPLVLGSVKTNLGHLESAAGIAGLIKVVLSLQHEMIPPHLHLRRRSPNIPWPAFPVIIPDRPLPWPRSVQPGHAPRLAGVSGFGFSGANAHLVIEEAPLMPGEVETAGDGQVAGRPLHILTLSAPNDTALKALAVRYADHAEAHPEQPLGDAAYTANTGRAHFARRLAVAAPDMQALRVRLLAAAEGQRSRGVQTGSVARGARPRLAWLFSGHGGQYAAMGRQLYATQPVFRRTFDRCDELFGAFLPQSLVAVIGLAGEQGDGAWMHSMSYAQPALFALQAALADLWRSWGIQPGAVLGHSLGEYAAACVAGVFSLEDGVRLVAARSRLMDALPATGVMVAVFAGEETVKAAVAPYVGEVALAVYNGPQHHVIAGASAAVERIVQELDAAKIETRRLVVGQASHSPLMAPILDEFEQVAASIQLHRPQIRLISNVSGAEAGDEIATAAYWRSHLAQPVRFAGCMAALQELGYHHFLELGPQPMLLGIGRRCLTGDDLTWLPSLRTGHDDWEVMLDSLGTLYTAGWNVDWAGFDRPYVRQRVALPTYPFQRQRYWLAEAAPQPHAATVRPLIDKVVHSPLLQATIFETEFSAERMPFLADHRVHGEVVSPGACQVALALNAAGVSTGQDGPLVLLDVVLPQALVIPAGQARTVQALFSARPDGDARQEFKIASFAPNRAGGVSDPSPSRPIAHAHGSERAGSVSDPTRPIAHAHGSERAESVSDPSAVAIHAIGYVTALANSAAHTMPPPAVDLAALQAICAQPVDIDAFYAAAAAMQIELGPSFRWVAQAWRSGEDDGAQALARLALPPAVRSLAGYALHPGLLDACFQTAGFAGELGGETLVAFAFAALHLHRPAAGSAWWCHVVRTGPHKCNIQLLDAQGEVVAQMQDFQVRAAPASAVHSRPAWHDWLYAPAWELAAAAHTEPAAMALALSGETWLIFADAGGVGQALAAQLRRQGNRAVVVQPGESWQQADADTYQLAAGNAGDYRRLLASAGVVQRIVHLWSLDGSAISAGARDERQVGPMQALRLGCESALLLVQALQAQDASQAQPVLAPAGLWLVTRDAQAVVPGDRIDGLAQAGLWGLGRVLALEHPEFDPACIDLFGLASAEDSAEQVLAEIAAAVWTTQVRAGREHWVALRPAGRFVARLQRLEPKAPATVPSKPLRLEIMQRGLIENLQLRPYARRTPGRGEVEIQVQAAGLNFRDVLNVLGAYPGDPGPVGGECAGVIVTVGEDAGQFAPGDRVVAMAPGCFSQYATLDASYVAHMPSTLNAVEAAAMPTAYLTAYYGLHHLAHMKAGDRVLIHAAAGGVGMAAVQLATQAGAEVFATASPRKWDVLRRLGVKHIYHSRNVAFAAQILADTGGGGVDIVLNSLTGPGFMHANLDVLAEGGCLAEMSKRNVWTPEQVTAARPDVRYSIFDLGEACRQHPHLWQEMLAAVFRMLAQRQIQPLPCTVFPLHEAVPAFRTMQAAQHVGKIVLSMPAHGDEALQTPIVRSDGAYLITGGLGGLGLAIAHGLVEQGARHLLLVGRSKPGAGTQAQLAALAAQGVAVTVVQGDVSDRAVVAAILKHIDPAHPLRGVIHSAGVLDDGALLQQSWDRFERVLAPKVQGAWNLHELTQGMALDFFVVFSSASALLGNRGQSNYVAANTFLDALAHYRRVRGLPALSINWGAWAEVGLAAEMVRTQGAQLAAQGIGAIAPAEGVAAFLHLLAQPAAQAGVAPIHWPRFLKHVGQDAAFYAAFRAEVQPPSTHRAGSVSDLPPLPDGRASARAGGLSDLPIRRQLALAASESERSELLRTYLIQQAAQVLRTAPAELDAGEALTYLGLDSLMALELRNRIDSGLQLSVPVPQLLQGASISDLQQLLLEKLKESNPSGPGAEPVNTAGSLPLDLEQDAVEMLAHLDELSEENVDLLLERLLAEEESGA